MFGAYSLLETNRNTGTREKALESYDRWHRRLVEMSPGRSVGLSDRRPRSQLLCIPALARHVEDRIRFGGIAFQNLDGLNRRQDQEFNFAPSGFALQFLHHG